MKSSSSGKAAEFSLETYIGGKHISFDELFLADYVIHGSSLWINNSKGTHLPTNMYSIITYVKTIKRRFGLRESFIPKVRLPTASTSEAASASTLFRGSVSSHKPKLTKVKVREVFLHRTQYPRLKYSTIMVKWGKEPDNEVIRWIITRHNKKWV